MIMNFSLIISETAFLKETTILKQRITLKLFLRDIIIEKRYKKIFLYKGIGFYYRGAGYLLI